MPLLNLVVLALCLPASMYLAGKLGWKMDKKFEEEEKREEEEAKKKEAEEEQKRTERHRMELEAMAGAIAKEMFKHNRRNV